MELQQDVSKIIQNLSLVEKGKLDNALCDHVLIASCKNDLVVVQKMLDILYELHSYNKSDFASFLMEYLQEKTGSKEKKDCPL